MKRLIALIDAGIGKQAHLAKALRQMPETWWHDLAKAAGINQPSSTTIARVIAHYEENHG